MDDGQEATYLNELTPMAGGNRRDLWDPGSHPDFFLVRRLILKKNGTDLKDLNTEENTQF